MLVLSGFYSRIASRDATRQSYTVDFKVFCSSFYTCKLSIDNEGTDGDTDWACFQYLYVNKNFVDLRKKYLGRLKHMFVSGRRDRRY
jgi:hypothetical protein